MASDQVCVILLPAETVPVILLPIESYGRKLSHADSLSRELFFLGSHAKDHGSEELWQETQSCGQSQQGAIFLGQEGLLLYCCFTSTVNI